MNPIVLIQDPQLTITFKTLIILISSLVCFAASLVMLVLSWKLRTQNSSDSSQTTTELPVSNATGELNPSKNSPPTEDSARGTTESGATTVAGTKANVEVETQKVEAVASASSDGSLIESQDAVPPVPEPGRDNLTASDFDLRMHNLQEQFAAVLVDVKTVLQRVDDLKSSMPSDLLACLQHQEELKREREMQLQKEEEQRLRAESEARRDSLAKALKSRFEGVIRQYDITQISTTTKEILSALNIDPYSQNNLAKNFPDYIDVADRLKNLTTQFVNIEQRDQTYLESLESELDSFEKLVSDVHGQHQPVWFTNLLEFAGRHSPLETRVAELREMLKLEEVLITVGTVASDLGQLDVIESDGLGKTAIVSDMMESGYRLKDTHTVVKRPKVKIRFEA